MKQMPLEKRLLSAIVAVSFAAIIVSLLCFTLMLSSVRDRSLERGGQTTDELIAFVMQGFAQNEGNALYYVFNHVAFMLEGQSFPDDESLLRYAADEFDRVKGDYDPDHAFFVARDGRITAAMYVDEEKAVSEISAEEVTRMLEEAKLTAQFEGPLSLSELLSPDYSEGCVYDLRNENLPMLKTVPIGEGDVVGLFYPRAASQPVFEALQNFSGLAHSETSASIHQVVGRYLLILAAFSAILLLAIGFIAHRLSRAVAAPVEREKELMERVNRLKTEFLANVSHELKTPLTVMSSHAQYGQMTLEDIPETEDARRGMRLIASEADRLALMVSQVLDLSQIEEGRMTLNRREHSVMEMIQSAMDVYYPMFGKNSSKLRVEPAVLPPVLCDAARAGQVLVNLVSNAARHTRGGEITIRAEQEGDMVRVSVTDTGDGIAPEEMAGLFERYRAKKAPGDTGTGLGLYISKYIVEAHGGTLTIESELGRGTVASFTLPVA